MTIGCWNLNATLEHLHQIEKTQSPSPITSDIGDLVEKTYLQQIPFQNPFSLIFPRSLKTSPQSLEERGRSSDFSQSPFFHCSRTPLDFRHPWPACTKRGKGKGEERRFLMIDKWVHLIKEIRFSQSSATTLHYSSQLCFFNPLQQISRRGEQRFGGDTFSPCLNTHVSTLIHVCRSEVELSLISFQSTSTQMEWG